MSETAGELDEPWRVESNEIPPSPPDREVSSPPASDVELGQDRPDVPQSIVGRRVAAGFIDLVPLLLISFALSERVDSDTSTVQFRVSGVQFLLLAAISFTYYFLAETLSGSTLGKRLMGLVVLTDDGGRPGAGAIVIRTVLRLVDGLPVLYLVGFVCVLATPDKRRIGDMVSHTRVGRLQSAANGQGESTQRSKGRFAIATVLGVLALVGGVAGTIVRASQSSPSERLGHFEYDRDVVPLVARVMGEFEQPTPTVLAALFPPGSVSTSDMSDLLTNLNTNLGAFSGDFTIRDHRKIHDLDFGTLGAHDVIQVRLDARFSKSTQPVIVTVAVINGQLVMVHWDINPS